MIEIIKRYVKKNINLPGGIIHGFPLTENQYNASIDKSKKIIPSYIILLDEPGGEEDVEDEEIISKIERFHLIKDIVRGRADEIESLNINLHFFQRLQIGLVKTRKYHQFLPILHEVILDFFSLIQKHFLLQRLQASLHSLFLGF